MTFPEKYKDWLHHRFSHFKVTSVTEGGDGNWRGGKADTPWHRNRDGRYLCWARKDQQKGNRDDIYLNLKMDQLNPEHIDSCYTPLIMSGGKYDLKPGENNDDEPLHFGTICCAVGARYKSYCSNVARTYLVDPSRVSCLGVDKYHDFGGSCRWPDSRNKKVTTNSYWKSSRPFWMSSVPVRNWVPSTTLHTRRSSATTLIYKRVLVVQSVTAWVYSPFHLDLWCLGNDPDEGNRRYTIIIHTDTKNRSD